MNKFKKWLDAAKKLAIFHEAKVACPECDTGELKVVDIALAPDNSVYERVLFCGHCKAQNSLRMTDENRFLGSPCVLSKEEQVVADEIKSAYIFSEKANDKL